MKLFNYLRNLNTNQTIFYGSSNNIGSSNNLRTYFSTAIKNQNQKEKVKNMAIHEISDVLHKYAKETVLITHVRIGFFCSVCGKEWGISLDDNQNLLIQAMKMVCLPCYQKTINNNGKGENYENSNNQYQK